MHIFYADKFEGTVKECDEGELCWVNKKDIFSLPIWEGDKIFLRLLDEKTPFFSLKLEYMGERLVNAVLNGEKLNVGKGTL